MPDNPVPNPNDKIARVRQRAQLILSRFASSSDSASRESFLLKDGNFCGIRFALGAFHAIWRIGHPEIEVYRDRQLLDRIPTDPQPIRRAA